MTAIYKIFVAFVLLTLTTACATTSKPAEHVAACHKDAGLLDSSSECVKMHNNIVAEQEKASASRREHKRIGRPNL